MNDEINREQYEKKLAKRQKKHLESIIVRPKVNFK